MNCCICNKKIDVANNANPVVDGQCCDDCNRNYVLPFRYFLSIPAHRRPAVIINNEGVHLLQPRDTYFTLEELQNGVKGYIEITQEIIKDCVSVVNEEGLLKGLEFNAIANKMFKINIVGNFLLVPINIFEKPE